MKPKLSVMLRMHISYNTEQREEIEFLVPYRMDAQKKKRIDAIMLAYFTLLMVFILSNLQRWTSKEWILTSLVL